MAERTIKTSLTGKFDEYKLHSETNQTRLCLYCDMSAEWLPLVNQSREVAAVGRAEGHLSALEVL